MSNKISFSTVARSQLKKGINTLCDAVKVTLGPLGKNVAINIGGQPLITNDGVTIAQNITLENAEENFGASVVKQSALKTNSEAGDGTTTTLVLAQSLFNLGIQKIDLGYNAMSLKIGMKKALEFVSKWLKDNAVQNIGAKELENVATISCQDESLGKLIATAYSNVGKTGLVTMQTGNYVNDEIIYELGMQLNSGFLSPYFCNNNEKTKVEYANAKTLICNKKIKSPTELMPVLEFINANKTPLLLICSSISEEALSMLALNKLQGNIEVCVVNLAEQGEFQQAKMEDIAILTESKLISSCSDNILPEHLGSAKNVKVSQNLTTFSGTANETLINTRLKSIQEQISNCSDEYNKFLLINRLATLSGKVAVIKLSGATIVELTEKKLRCEDAINSCKNALENGIVAGGGMSLFACKNFLIKEIKHFTSEEKIGANIVADSLSSPLKTILENAGISSDLILNKLNIKLKTNPMLCYDANKSKFCKNYIECGILDPLKVTLNAITNAVSVVSTLLTTNCLIV